jgi:anti-sigma factor RsiW
MNCDEAEFLLEAYVDGELEPGQRLELERHLISCPSCKALLRDRQQFRSFFTANAPVYTAPPELKTRVLTAVRREQTKQARTTSWRPWFYAAAAVVLGLGLALSYRSPGKYRELSRQAVVEHAQSLATNHLVEISSTEQKFLKPWFTARLGFSPPLADLGALGYVLVGGRTDAINNRSVAVLVYKYGSEIIALFLWPAEREHLSNGDDFINGYRICTWSTAASNCIVVSKLSDSQMDKFVDVFRDKATANEAE